MVQWQWHLRVQVSYINGPSWPPTSLRMSIPPLRATASLSRALLDPASGIVSSMSIGKQPLHSGTRLEVRCARTASQVEGNDFAAHGSPAVVVRGQATAVIRENHFRDNQDYGVIVCGTARPTIANNRVTGHKLPAIAIRDEAGGTIMGNCLWENAGYGIVVCGSGQPLVEANNVRAHKLPGIAVMDQAKAIVRGNLLEDNEGVGIAVNNTAQPILEGNTLRFNKRTWSSADGDGQDGDPASRRWVKRAAIAIRDQASGIVRANILDGNDGYGILVCDRAWPTLEGNDLREHRRAAIAIQDHAEAVLLGNRMEGNYCDILVCGAARPTLKGNVPVKRRRLVLSVQDRTEGFAGRDELLHQDEKSMVSACGTELLPSGFGGSSSCSASSRG